MANIKDTTLKEMGVCGSSQRFNLNSGHIFINHRISSAQLPGNKCTMMHNVLLVDSMCAKGVSGIWVFKYKRNIC